MCSKGEADGDEIEALLARVAEGDEQAKAALIELLMAELRARARKMMRGQMPGHTLQTTALVNEVYLRVLEGSSSNWNGRKHLMAVMAVAMRRVLIDHSRRKGRKKRSPGGEREHLDGIEAQCGDVDLLALNEALTSLRELDATAADLVDLRYFAGLPMREAAAIAGLSVRSAERRWTFARAYLRDRLA